MNDFAIAVAFCALLITCVMVANSLLDWFWRRIAIWWLLPILGVVMILCAYALTQTPAPVAPQQDEPTPTLTSWPTETPWPESGIKDILDVVLTNQEQQSHYLEVIMTAVAPNPSATAPILGTPTVTPTATPDQYVARCGVCLDSEDCAPGFTCIYCGGKRRCVDRNFPNSDCMKCKEELGIP